MYNALRDTLVAKVYDVATKTPLDTAAKLSTPQTTVYLKREDLQPVHSFKLRGAYNKISQLTPAEKKRGVLAASAGNHAQGVALAAKELNISALIVMPTTTPSIKVEAVKSYGATVELYGDSYSDAQTYALKRLEETGRIFVHPFDDPLIIAGQGTVGREIVEQLPDVTHIFVPIGGGGLIAGIAQYVKSINPSIRIIGVEPEDSNAMQLSLEAGERISLNHVGIFADGVAVKQVGEHTFSLCQQYVDEVITVTTDQICAGIKAVFEDTRAIVEPAGALATAGIMQYSLPPHTKAVAVCSGANMTFERLQQIAERTLIGSGKEALFEVTLSEKPQSLLRFCREVINGNLITELSYRCQTTDNAHVFVGVNIADHQEKQRFMQKMSKQHYTYTDLSSDDLAKTHVRHMIGGLRDGAKEHFYEVTFPERPGTLADFLANMPARSSISLFHYRTTASDTGSVLVGFEETNKNDLEQSLTRSGFEFKHVDKAPSLQLFV